MTTVEALRLLLDQVCQGRLAYKPAELVKLGEHLNNNYTILLNVLDNEPKNPENRTKLLVDKEAKIKLVNEEITLKVNEDFVKEAIFLSDHLNINENTAARLLDEGIKQAPTVNSTPLDTAVYIYHAERGYVTSILIMILEAAKDTSLSPHTRHVFATFMENLVNVQNTKGSYVKRILQSTQDIGTIKKELHKNGMLESAKDTKQNLLKLWTEKNHVQPTEALHASIQTIEFGPDTIELRKEKLSEERVALVQILYHLCSLFWLEEQDILEILKQLKSINLSSSIAPYLVIAFMTIISTENSDLLGNDLSTNDDLLQKLHGQICNTPWEVNAIEAVIHIQWAAFIKSISNSRSTKVSFDHMDLAKRAIQQDAFGFINKYLLYFKQKSSTENSVVKTVDNDNDSDMAVDGLTVDPNDYAKFDVYIDTDFQDDMVHVVEQFSLSIIYNLFGIFDSLKGQPTKNKDEIDYTITKFLTLLASVYRDRLDAGLKFWKEGKLYDVLIYLVELNIADCLPATFDFFGSISTGIESAEYAHNTMKSAINKSNIHESGLFSWGKLFGTLAKFIDDYKEYTSKDSTPSFVSIEESSLCKFLYFCQQTVQYSATARKEIWDDSSLNAHRSIVSMINCSTSSAVRAALYDTLAAFCSKWGGCIDKDEDISKSIALQVWNTIENSEMIVAKKEMVDQPTEAVKATPVPNTLFSGFIQTPLPATIEQVRKPRILSSDQPSGFMLVFHEEKKLKLYTQTQAILTFLASLVHTQSKREELISGFSVFEPSVPVLLGFNQRTPGTFPYVSLVIDHIFLGLKNQEYVHTNTRWSLTESCLAFIENSIVSFDISTIVDLIQYRNQRLSRNSGAVIEDSSLTSLQQALANMITLPGYDILVRILSGGALLQELLTIVQGGKDAILKHQKVDKSDDFRRCVAHCLRIFLKVLRIQNAFVNMVVPQLQLAKIDAQDIKLGDCIFSLPHCLCSLGNLMMNHTGIIEQIVLLINCNEYEDICRTSALILSHLASSPNDDTFQFPNHVNIPMGGVGSVLASILLSSDKASSIIFGLSERLEIDTSEMITFDKYEYNINVIPFWKAVRTLNDIYRLDKQVEEDDTAFSIRIIILDILLQNIGKDDKSPTVTEFLLGYDVKEMEASGRQSTVIDTDAQHKSRLACFSTIVGLAFNEDGNMTHPVLAEKCFRLFYQLCARKSTSVVTLEYLRSNPDNLLLKQFERTATRLETSVYVAESDFKGVMRTFNISEGVETDFFTMVSSLQQRAWILKLVALELHQREFNHKDRLDLLASLYHCSEISVVDELANHMADLKLQLETGCQQPLWNMLEIVSSLQFRYRDELYTPAAEIALVHFKHIDVNLFISEKEGYKVYDIRALYKVLRQIEFAKGKIDDQERINLQTEMVNILERCMSDNRYNAISFARLQCLQAWKQVIQVTLADCFSYLTSESRARIIYSLLTFLLPKLEKKEGITDDILEGLAEVVLTLVKRLREDKRRESFERISPYSTESRLADEKLHLLFTSVLKSIRKEDSTIQVRSLMYSSLFNFVEYINSDQEMSIAHDIRSRVIDVFQKEPKDKLLKVICNDATHGLEMHKTTAYMALEVFYVLGGKLSDRSINDYLVKDNFLHYTIRMIRQSDQDLLSVIGGRDVSLTPLYHHEAKLSLLVQMAMQKRGAALLLSNDLIKSISHCGFINPDLKPMQRRDLKTVYKFERHALMLSPILELLNAILISIGAEAAALYSFKEWASQQRILATILKDEIATNTLSGLYLLRLATLFMSLLSSEPYYFNELEKSGLVELDELMIKLIPLYCLAKEEVEVKPVSKEEIAWSNDLSSDSLGKRYSLLDSKAKDHITVIKKNILSYVRSSIFRKDHPAAAVPSFIPVIANTLDSIKVVNHAQRGPLMPTITTLVSCLSLNFKKMIQALADRAVLRTQILNVGSLKYDEILEIINTAIPKTLDVKYDSLKSNEKVLVIVTEIKRRITLKKQEVEDLEFIVETTLMILWKHLDFYLDRRSILTNTTASPCERRLDENIVLQRQLLYQTSNERIRILSKACQVELEPVLRDMELAISLTPFTTAVIGKIRKTYK